MSLESNTNVPANESKKENKFRAFLSSLKEKRANKKKKKEKKSVGYEIMSWICTLLAAVVIASLVRAFIVEPVRVDGASMQNTLMDREIVLVSKMAYGKGTKGIERGDVIICRYPNREKGSFHLGAGLSMDSYEVFVKRLVALPGDTVEIKSGVLYVNDAPVDNPEKMGSAPRADFPKYTLKNDNPMTDKDEAEYFVIGDNRGNSNDSRAVGPISRDMIMGKAVCVLFPFKSIRSIK